MIRQPTSICPLLISRSQAFAAPCSGTPSASTASVSVPSPSLFQIDALLNVASVKTNVEVSVRPFKSVNGTRNSITSFIVEIAICEAATAYQTPASNHSITGAPTELKCSASCRLGLMPSRTARLLSSPRNAWPPACNVSMPMATCGALCVLMFTIRISPYRYVPSVVSRTSVTSLSSVIPGSVRRSPATSRRIHSSADEAAPCAAVGAVPVQSVATPSTVRPPATADSAKRQIKAPRVFMSWNPTRRRVNRLCAI